MALRNPYTTSHANEHERLTLTSVFPLIEQTFDDKEHVENTNLSNQIISTNDNNKILADKNTSFDVKSTLFNQENNELLPILTDVNEKINTHIEPNAFINGPYMSHMPIMSSSSSSSSLSVPTQHKTVKFDSIVNQIDDPRTRSIVVGKETLIEIDRGQSGLGLSVVGGSDTQLVDNTSSHISKLIIFFSFSQRLLFMIFMTVVLHNAMVDYVLVIKFWRFNLLFNLNLNYSFLYDRLIQLIYVQQHMKKRSKHYGNQQV
jgi:hypothetical protein